MYDMTVGNDCWENLKILQPIFCLLYNFDIIKPCLCEISILKKNYIPSLMIK